MGCCCQPGAWSWFIPVRPQAASLHRPLHDEIICHILPDHMDRLADYPEAQLFIEPDRPPFLLPDCKPNRLMSHSPGFYQTGLQQFCSIAKADDFLNNVKTHQLNGLGAFEQGRRRSLPQQGRSSCPLALMNKQEKTGIISDQGTNDIVVKVNLPR